MIQLVFFMHNYVYLYVLLSFSGEQDVLYSVFSQLQNQLFQFRWTRPLYTVFINQPRLVVLAYNHAPKPIRRSPERIKSSVSVQARHAWWVQRIPLGGPTRHIFLYYYNNAQLPPSSQASCLLKIDGCPWGCCCCCVDRPLMDLFFHDLHTNILTTEFNGNLPGSPSQEETLSISGKLVTESKNWIYDRFWI